MQIPANTNHTGLLSRKSRILARLRQLKGLLQTSASAPVQNPQLLLSSGNRWAFIKRDGIGDFVLATTFLEKAYVLLEGKEVTLYCHAESAELAKIQYPKWKVIVVPNVTRVTDWPGQNSGLRNLFEKEMPHDILVDLRATRFVNDTVISSWGKASLKIAIANQYSMSSLTHPKEKWVYQMLVAAPEENLPADGSCREIRNQRILLKTLFGEVAGSDDAWPKLADFSSFWDKGLCPGLEPHRTLLIAPFSGGRIKEYPTNALLNVLRAFQDEHDIDLAILGGPERLADSAFLEKELSQDGKCWNLTGKLSLTQSGALLQKARGLLSVDTGLAHIAAASNKPVIIILGGGHYGQFAPWTKPGSWVQWLNQRMPCENCNWFCIQAEPFCITSITEESILDCLRLLFGQRPDYLL